MVKPILAGHMGAAANETDRDAHKLIKSILRDYPVEVMERMAELTLAGLDAARTRDAMRNQLALPL